MTEAWQSQYDQSVLIYMYLSEVCEFMNIYELDLIIFGKMGDGENLGLDQSC